MSLKKAQQKQQLRAGSEDIDADSGINKGQGQKHVSFYIL